MASSVLEGKHIDVKEVFTLLESQETQVTEGIKTLIQENLSTTKESWLVHSLVDYYYMSQSQSVVEILCSLQEPHDKHVLDKLHDGIKFKEHQYAALQLLLQVACKQPRWVAKMINTSVLKVIIKALKVETNIPVLMTAVTIVTVMLPTVPAMVGPYLPDIFEVFFRLASFTIKRPAGNTPDIFYLHLHISVYALFHRLYGMFPYNFLAYMRHYCSKKENTPVFEEVIKPMIERVRLHPLLINGTKEHETSVQRWRAMETHDVVVECSRMSLDPVEGSWEELQCPVIASRYTGKYTATLTSTLTAPHQPASLTGTGSLPPITASSATPILSSQEFSPGPQSQDMFWSPSEVIGLSTPPPSQRATPAVDHATTTCPTTQTSSGPALTISAGTTITPMNTPNETPPMSEETERTMARTNSRGVMLSKLVDPKRLSCELPGHSGVPLLTPSSLVASVPPSPLKAEFTSTPPFGLKNLPVFNAARELHFDHDHSEEGSIKQLTKASQSREDTAKSITKNDQQDSRLETSAVVKSERSNSGVERPDSSTAERLDSKIGAQGQGQSSGNVVSADVPMSPRRIPSVTFFEDSIKLSSQDEQDQQTIDRVNQQTGGVDLQTEKSRASSDSSGSQVDTVSIDNISQVIEGLESHDEDNDDEVSELMLSSRSSIGSYPCNVTAESVKRFMKSANRIRFNSLTATANNEQPTPNKKFGGKHRSRSCPQFPKIDSVSDDEDEVSRSVSTTCNDSVDNGSGSGDTDAGVAIDQTDRLGDNQVSENFDHCDISVTSTGSTVTVNTKKETTVTITSTKSSEINIGQCPVYSGSLGRSGPQAHGAVESDLMRIFQQILSPQATVCSKCNGQLEDSQSSSVSSHPFFSTFSPPELLDRHISLGRDIHAKELSKIPMPSTQDVNWTHFGGMPPADEISILRGQLMLVHNQLMLERHKRDQHAIRNRRLLRKITHTKILEEQNNAMTEQLKQQELEIRDLHVSLKLLQEENRKLKTSQDSEEYEKLVQLRSCLQENQDLKNVKKEFNMLLVRQREEQDNLNKKLMSTEAKLFNTSKELEKLQEVTLLNTKLREQVLQLHKELLLMGELQQQSSEKILSSRSSKAAQLEHDHVKNTLTAEIKGLRQELNTRTLQAENYMAQLKEQQEVLSTREITLMDLKNQLEKIKARHMDELRCVEDKHAASMRVNQELESHVLQLYADIEQVKAKAHRRSVRISSHHDDVTTSSEDRTDTSMEEFRDRTTSDPSQQKHSLKKKTLSRMISLPAQAEPSDLQESQSLNSDLDLSRSSHFDPRSSESNQRSTESSARFPLTRSSGGVRTSIVEDFEVVPGEFEMEGHVGLEGQGDRLEGEGRQLADRSETVSMTSRDSNLLYPGQQKLLYTDSEDSRSVSNKSNIADSSGF